MQSQKVSVSTYAKVATPTELPIGRLARRLKRAADSSATVGARAEQARGSAPARKGLELAMARLRPGLSDRRERGVSAAGGSPLSTSGGRNDRCRC